MYVYIAGKLCSEEERKFLEEIEILCHKIGFKTFLPHRDCGLVCFKSDIKKIFEEDKKALEECDLVVAVLNGDHIGAGTAWELGYAYALGKKCIGLKSDKNYEECIEQLSSMLLSSVEIVNSLEELKNKLESIKNGKNNKKTNKI